MTDTSISRLAPPATRDRRQCQVASAGAVVLAGGLACFAVLAATLAPWHLHWLFAWYVAALSASLAGVWLLTVVRAPGASGAAVGRWRWAARGGYTVGAALELGLVVRVVYWHLFPGLYAWMAAGAAALAVGLVCLCAHLHGVARAAGAPRLALWTRVLAWLLAAVSVGVVLVLISAYTIWAHQSLTLNQALRYVDGAVIVLGLATAVLAAGLMLAYAWLLACLGWRAH